tara:strand:- start:586 stop:1200 length:615 start_codon:yes stop_codon:yes gene_type:complete
MNLSLKKLNHKYISPVIYIICLIPFFVGIFLIFKDNLGPNPIEFIIKETGSWAIYFICLTLMISPIIKITNINKIIFFRRIFGLFSFFYAFLHFISFIWFEHFFDIREIYNDVISRPFITIGFISFILLIPLALTSNSFMMKSMGKFWKKLHMLIYLISILAVFHFWWMRSGKNDFDDPILLGLIIFSLLLFRIIKKIFFKIRF